MCGRFNLRANAAEVAEVLGIADALAKFANKKKITSPLLANDGSKTIEAVGPRDTNDKGYTIQGMIIFGQKGIVRKKTV